MNSHKDLLVYQKSLDLVEMIYNRVWQFSDRREVWTDQTIKKVCDIIAF